jgi:hypothetical protein
MISLFLCYSFCLAENWKRSNSRTHTMPEPKKETMASVSYTEELSEQKAHTQEVLLLFQWHMYRVE